MSIEELANELGVKHTYLKNQWKRVKERYGKIGIELYKVGKADRAIYGIKNYGDKEIRW